MSWSRIGMLAVMLSSALLVHVPAVEAATGTTLYTFKGGVDGYQSNPGLVYARGTLYGTTAMGGDGDCLRGYEDCGVLFSFNLDSRTKSTDWSFGEDDGDGAVPLSGPVRAGGTLFGTTREGGAYCLTGLGCGTAYAYDLKTGARKVLHSFGSGSDGSFPTGGLLDVRGTLYGTTYQGGANGGGTVFSVDPKTGAEAILYSFCSLQNCTDGWGPVSSLLYANGRLYGTTIGTSGCSSAPCGVAFSVDPKTGAEQVIYSFCGGQDCPNGSVPSSGLIDVEGVLYGTTKFGGANGLGTVYALDPATGTQSIVYSFEPDTFGGHDGAYPSGNLLNVNGKLYGTTLGGGGGICGTPQEPGCGTVFTIDPATGIENVAYSFCNAERCAPWPNGDLIEINGTLYGTTLDTVFALTP